MGVSVDTGGKGRGKSMGVDLNLVPFIDFLSCLLAFLMMTAVWAEISAIEHDQLVSSEPSIPVVQDPPPPPPLTINITAEGYQVLRKPEDLQTVPKIEATDPTQADDAGKQYDVVKLNEIVTKDRETYPEEKMVVIYTVDGVYYGEMIKVLDLTRVLKYKDSALAGGPPPTLPAAATPAPG